MKLAEALEQCALGARMTAAHMQDGSYIEHSFARGFLRCWGFDPPQRTQCDFIEHPDDTDADWFELIRIKPVRSAWGMVPNEVIVSHIEAEAAPVVDPILAVWTTPKTEPKRDAWGKPL